MPGRAPGRGWHHTDGIIKGGVSEQADALQEAPDDLHEDTVEMLRLDHVREMNSIRQKFRDEVGALRHQTRVQTSRHEQQTFLISLLALQESAERQQLLSSLQDERERLQAAHAAQLENLRFQFDKQIQEMKLEHSLMVRLKQSAVDPKPVAPLD